LKSDDSQISLGAVRRADKRAFDPRGMRRLVPAMKAGKIKLTAKSDGLNIRTALIKTRN
jgi:hypothetical protein